MTSQPLWMLGPVGKKRLRVARLQEKYLEEKIIPTEHVAIQHKSVSVIVLPKFCIGRKFKIKLVKSYE